MIRSTALFALAVATFVSAQEVHIYQAEQAKLTGTTVGTSVAGYSGNIQRAIQHSGFLNLTYYRYRIC
jgi:hypothetical protein